MCPHRRQVVGGCVGPPHAVASGLTRQAIYTVVRFVLAVTICYVLPSSPGPLGPPGGARSKYNESDDNSTHHEIHSRRDD